MIRRVMMLCTIALLVGCPEGKIRKDDVAVARAFYAQPVRVQMATFRQHPLADQLDLFFYGNQVRHPPAIYLARCFALGGEPAVELLRLELSAKSDDLTVRDISTLLAAVETMGKFDVSNDADLMRALRSRVSAMQDQRWRDTAEKRIATIEGSDVVAEVDAPECGQPE